MIDLLVNGAVFLAVEAGKGNYMQISGEFKNGLLVPISCPLTDWIGQTLLDTKIPELSTATRRASLEIERPLSEITLVRSRMLYARAALNSRGSVYVGLRHIREFSHGSLKSVLGTYASRCFEPMPLPHCTLKSS